MGLLHNNNPTTILEPRLSAPPPQPKQPCSKLQPTKTPFWSSVITQVWHRAMSRGLCYRLGNNTLSLRNQSVHAALPCRYYSCFDTNIPSWLISCRCYNYICPGSILPFRLYTHRRLGLLIGFGTWLIYCLIHNRQQNGRTIKGGMGKRGKNWGG